MSKFSFQANGTKKNSFPLWRIVFGLTMLTLFYCLYHLILRLLQQQYLVLNEDNFNFYSNGAAQWCGGEYRRLMATKFWAWFPGLEPFCEEFEPSPSAYELQLPGLPLHNYLLTLYRPQICLTVCLSLYISPAMNSWHVQVCTSPSHNPSWDRLQSECAGISGD